MEQSSLPPNSDPDQKSKLSSGRNGDARVNDSRETGNQRMIADRLLAALSSGNLDHLARAREAFLQQSPTAQNNEAPAEKPRQAKAHVPPAIPESVARLAVDLEDVLERRSAPRT